MKNTALLLLATLILSGSFSYAQIHGNGGTPIGFKVAEDLKSIPNVYFSSPDIDALRAEDAEVDGKGIAPWRFGYNNYTDLDFNNSGRWINLGENGRLWQLKITCEQAQTVNLMFTKTQIPEGNLLYLYNPEKTFVLGAFTQNWIYEGSLFTELVPGSTLIVEYYVSPENINNRGNIHIEQVVHGYRTAKEFQEKAFGGAASCNMNVACSDANGWEDQIRSAVMLASNSSAGSGFCSGALINNTANDGKPYVLTANHCASGINAGATISWFFRFNWQSATCNNPGSIPAYQSLNGGIMRAKRTPSDFALVEITGGLSNGTVPASHTPYFSGWNRSNTAPTSTVCIHHPAGDIKKISFDDDPATAVQAMGSSEANSSWRVVWDRNTTTEGGSSGSPLFDQNKRIIGQLWGGSASCNNLNGPDYYGRLYNSWEPSGSNSTNQLKYWLDPTGSGQTAIDGYDPYLVTVTLDAKLESVVSPISVSCNTSVTPVVKIKNSGTNTLTSATVSYRIDNGAWVTQNWTGNLATGATANVSFAAVTVSEGTHTFRAKVESPNGGIDLNQANDSISTSFEILNSTPVALPIIEGFEGSFVPNGWLLTNPDNSITWAKFNAGSNSSNSARVNNFNYTQGSGQKDYLTSPFFSLVGADTAMLTFDVSYARYNNNNTYYDELAIEISSDCGQTWTSLYNKSGSALATSANTAYNFIPNSQSQWRTESIDLEDYLNMSSLQIRFVSTSKYGNNLYIDNINIGVKQSSTNNIGVEEFNVSNIKLWPNPSSDKVNIEVMNVDKYDLSLYNAVGQKIYAQANVSGLIQINVSDYASGIYFVEVKVEGKPIRKKIIVQ